MSDDEVMTLETALNSINNTLDEAWEGFANAYVVEADQSAWAEIARLARLGAAAEADLVPAVKWFLDNPCDYPGGQDNTGLKQAIYRITGWQPDWLVFERLEAKPHTAQVVNLRYKLND